VKRLVPGWVNLAAGARVVLCSPCQAGVVRGSGEAMGSPERWAGSSCRSRVLSTLGCGGRLGLLARWGKGSRSARAFPSPREVGEELRGARVCEAWQSGMWLLCALPGGGGRCARRPARLLRGWRLRASALSPRETRLDAVLCSLLWVTLLGQGVGLGDPQRALPAPTMLGFCEVGNEESCLAQGCSAAAAAVSL